MTQYAYIKTSIMQIHRKLINYTYLKKPKCIDIGKTGLIIELVMMMTNEDTLLVFDSDSYRQSLDSV